MLGILFGINGILLGIGLILAKSKYRGVFIATGIIQIVISPMFIIPFQIINLIGIILAVPFLIMLVIAVFLEYREAKSYENTGTAEVSGRHDYEVSPAN
jgi:hypothetical protein